MLIYFYLGGKKKDRLFSKKKGKEGTFLNQRKGNQFVSPEIRESFSKSPISRDTTYSSPASRKKVTGGGTFSRILFFSRGWRWKYRRWILNTRKWKFFYSFRGGELRWYNWGPEEGFLKKQRFRWGSTEQISISGWGLGIRTLLSVILQRDDQWTMRGLEQLWNERSGGGRHQHFLSKNNYRFMRIFEEKERSRRRLHPNQQKKDQKNVLSKKNTSFLFWKPTLFFSNPLPSINHRRFRFYKMIELKVRDFWRPFSIAWVWKKWGRSRRKKLQDSLVQAQKKALRWSELQHWRVLKKKKWYGLDKHCHFWKKLMWGRGFSLYYRDRVWRLKREQTIIRWDERLKKKVVEFVPRVPPFKKTDFFFFSRRKISRRGWKYHFKFAFCRSWKGRKIPLIYFKKRLPYDLELNYKVRCILLANLLTDSVSHKKVPSFLHHAVIAHR